MVVPAVGSADPWPDHLRRRIALGGGDGALLPPATLRTPPRVRVPLRIGTCHRKPRMVCLSDSCQDPHASWSARLWHSV